MTIDVRSPAAASEGGLDKKHAELKKATQQFESYFLHELLKEMRKTVPKDTLIKDDGDGQQIFKDMMDQTLADSMSQRGDLGMAAMLYTQLAPTLGDASKSALKKPAQTTDTQTDQKA